MARRNEVPETVSHETRQAKATKMSEEQRVAHVNAGIAKHPGFSEGDVEDMRKSAAFVADPKNAIRGLLVEGTLKHDAERPVFYSRNDWEGGQEGFQGDRFSMASSLDDGRVVVFPSIYADKDGVTRLHTGKDAFDHYQESGEHFGIYDSIENANRAAEWSHHAGNAGWLKRHEKQQDAKGGDAPGASAETPPSGPAPAQPQGGPRIVVNPSTFRNEKDALCVAFNEAFRVVMEDLEFEPQSEPTDEQRRFFSDTAYADDELQLRRTILARICTFDTSVEDPTDEQLQEAVEFLETVQEAGAPQNGWERNAVQRLRDMVAKVLEDGEGNASAPPPPPQGDSVQADEGGGVVQQDDEERRRREAEEAARAEEEAKAEDAKREAAPPQRPALVPTEPTGRLARDLERIARSSKSDRDTFMLENMQESGRYSADGADVPVSGVDALGLARTQPLTEDRQAIENAESARTEDYLARKREDEQRKADNHYTSDYVQDHDIGVAARKGAAAGRKTARNRWKDQEEEERRRNRGLGA